MKSVKMRHFLFMAVLVAMATRDIEGCVGGPLAGVDLDANSEAEADAAAVPEAPPTEYILDYSKSSPDDVAAAKKHYDLAKSYEDTPAQQYSAGYPMCKVRSYLQVAAWYTVRYNYDAKKKIWRYRRAWVPVRILHRACLYMPQHCSVYTQGCCVQEYNWVMFPVWFRHYGYPYRCYWWKIHWVYVRVKSCCCCYRMGLCSKGGCSCPSA